MRRLLTLIALLCACSAAGAGNTWVDENATGGSNDGSSPANAFLTLTQAIGASSVRAAGDTVFVRGIHTETLGADIAIDDDGGQDAVIVVQGDYGAHFQIAGWTTAGDSAATAPVFDVGTYSLVFTGDDYWELNHIKFTNCSDACVKSATTACLGFRCIDCSFYSFGGATNYGLQLQVMTGLAVVDGCTFDGGDGVGDDTNYGRAIYPGTGRTIVTDCIFSDLSYGIVGTGSSTEVTVYNSTFGNPDANTIDVSSQWVRVIGGDLPASPLFTGVYSQPIGQFFLAADKKPMTYMESGTLDQATSDYSIVHGGGAAYSLKVRTGSTCGLHNPVRLLDYTVDCDSAEARDYAIWVWRDVNWGTAPTAAELYLEVAYQTTDDGGKSAWAFAQSSATMVSDSTWTELEVAGVSPVHDGPVQLTLWLKDYDADGYIYVDPLLTATGESYHAAQFYAPDLAYNYVTTGLRRVLIIN